MKIELPLETWTELFGFVPRSQLKQLVPHIGDEKRDSSRGRKRRQIIVDRQFVSFVQFFLHKCGQVTLGQLRIISSRYGTRPIVIANANREDRMSLADVPIPGNVKDFQSILISNFDESVVAFLQKFQQKSLLDNVNLHFYDCSNVLCLWEIMTNFVPLFTNINSIVINNSAVLGQLFSIQREYSNLAIPMLTSARVLYVRCFICCDFWLFNWLHIPRADGKPRLLILQNSTFSHFIGHIKKDFLEANQAVSFFIKLENFRDNASVQPLTLENGQTQEILAIEGKSQGYDYVSISRYPMGTNKEEWEEEMSRRPDFDNRKIDFDPYPAD